MKVKVWNDNTTAWNEKFKGEDVKIPAKGYIEMEFYEAHEFKGQFSPIKVKGDGTQDTASFKMIRVEKMDQDASVEDEGEEIFPCNSCKKVFTTEAALVKHSDAQHSDQVVTDFQAEKEIPRKRGRPAKVTGAEVNG